MGIFKRLLNISRTSAGIFALTIGLGWLGGIVTIGICLQISKYVNLVFLHSTSTLELTPLLLSCLLFVMLRACISWAADYSAARAAIGIKQNLRDELLRHIFNVGPALLMQGDEDEGRTGELVNTTLQGIEDLEAYFSQYLPQIALSAIIPLTILITIFPSDFLTAIILLLTAPLLPAFMVLIGNLAKKLTHRQWISLSRMSAFFLDVLQGLTTLKILGRSREQAKTINEVSEKFRQKTIEVLRITFLSALTLELVATLSTAVVAVEIGLRLLYGRLGFEQAFLILLLIPEFYLPLRHLGLRFHAAMAGIEAAKRIFEILDTPARIDLSVHNAKLKLTQPLDITPPNIRFEYVSFAYTDGREGLIDASFDIPARKITVLAGESGSGKSTVLSLLLNFLGPQSGKILIDEVPLAEIAPVEWFSNIAWVPQHPYLFQANLMDNISLSHPEAGTEEIHAAAHLAHADEFIQTLPNNYYTQIGEHGARLSGGQAQRVALARAFLKNAPFLIFDEPEGHLDSRSAILIQDSLKILARNRTVLVVSHQAHSILEADQIIWLDHGRVSRIEHLEDIKPEKKPQDINGPKLSVSGANFQHQVPESRQSDKRLFGWSSFLRLIQLLRPFSVQVILSVLLGFLTIASSMGLMSTAAYLISYAALHPSIADLQVAIVAVRFFGLSRGVFRYLERLITHDVTFRLIGKLRGWFFSKIEPLVPARTLHRHSGDLLQHLTGEIAALEDFYVRTVAPPFVSFLTGVFTCMFLFLVDPKMGFFYIVMLILGGFVLPMITLMFNRRLGPDLIDNKATLSRKVVDALQGMPDLLASGSSERYLWSLSTSMRELGKIQSRLAILKGFQNATSRFVADLAMVGILWLGATLVEFNQVEGVLLGSLSLLVFSSFEAFYPLTEAALQFSTNMAAANKLFKLADTQPEVIDPSNPIQVPSKLNIKVRDLSFAYPPYIGDGSPSVLTNISLSILPGEKVAFVGPNGAGKTTLIMLLLRLWHLPNGVISLDGHDLNVFSGDELRKKISVLAQNPMLFSGTLFDNLRIANPQASQDEIEFATHLARISSWISTLPEKYQTWIGEDGIRLSGGQRQRLAIARTILRPSSLYIFDEPTIHLDPLLEQEVLHNILNLDAAVLIVTHRQIKKSLFDKIYMLDAGHITNITNQLV